MKREVHLALQFPVHSMWRQSVKKNVLLGISTLWNRDLCVCHAGSVFARDYYTKQIVHVRSEHYSQSVWQPICIDAELFKSKVIACQCNAINSCGQYSAMGYAYPCSSHVEPQSPSEAQSIWRAIDEYRSVVYFVTVTETHRMPEREKWMKWLLLSEPVNAKCQMYSVHLTFGVVCNTQ